MSLYVGGPFNNSDYNRYCFRSARHIQSFIHIGLVQCFITLLQHANPISDAQLDKHTSRRGIIVIMIVW